MFTGIIEELGTVEHIKKLKGGCETGISCTFADRLKVDQSVNINGVCHTVTGVNDASFVIQSVDETLRKTNIGKLEEGDSVNLERSLSAEKLLDGHLVQGHVDTVGTVSSIEKEGTDRLFTVEYPEKFRDLIVGRGSIAVDGISLTVAREGENRFTVAIIPYTFDHTNLKFRSVGDRVNLEFDILGKYVVRYLENRAKTDI